MFVIGALRDCVQVVLFFNSCGAYFLFVFFYAPVLFCRDPSNLHRALFPSPSVIGGAGSFNGGWTSRVVFWVYLCTAHYQMGV